MEDYSNYMYPSGAYPPYYYAQNGPAPRPYEYTDEKAVDPNATATSPTPSTRKSRTNTESGPFFNPTKQLCNLYSVDRSRSFACRLNPRIDRGFFLSDSDWTCYRRNYFQISISYSAVDASGNKVQVPCLVELEGRGLRTVTEFLVGVMARTSNGSREIDLIQHTAKRDKGPQSIPQPKPCVAQDPNVAYGMSVAESSHDTVVFERLQFKSATANNGKRRAAQQYHVVFAELLARCDDGCIARVASTESAPLVVRGRAPGHYANLKEDLFEEGGEYDEEAAVGEEYASPQEYSDRMVTSHVASRHIPPVSTHAAAHHMSYTSYASPTGVQPPPQTTWANEYYHHGAPYYSDPTVWSSAAAAASAAANRARETSAGYEGPGYEYNTTSMDQISANREEGTNLAQINGGLPTPVTNRSPRGDKKKRGIESIGQTEEELLSKKSKK